MQIDNKPATDKIQVLNPKSVFHRESQNLTPHIAEHLDDLSRVIGVHLELIKTEQRVGDRIIDIMARNPDTDECVIIENQLKAATDDDHLGRLLVYGWAARAKYVVWVAPSVRDEHRQTIDWLNSLVGEEISFFAVRFDVLKIGDSLPALHYSLEAAPSHFQRKLNGKQKPITVIPVQFAWRESPQKPNAVASWKDIFGVVLNTAAQEHLELRNLPIKHSFDPKESSNFLHPLKFTDSHGSSIWFEAHGDADTNQRRISSILERLDRGLIITLRDGKKIGLPRSKDLTYIQRTTVNV